MPPAPLRGMFYARVWVPAEGYSIRRDMAVVKDVTTPPDDSAIEPLLVDPMPTAITMKRAETDAEPEPPPMRVSRAQYPLTDRGIHRKFAKLKAVDPEDILRFANRYGMLGHPELAYDPTLDVQNPHPAERLTFWTYEIHKMLCLVSLWDWARDGNRGMLDRFVIWSDSPRRVLVALGVSGDELRRDIGDRVAQEDRTFSPARWVVEEGKAKGGAGIFARLLAKEGGPGNHDALLAEWDFGDVIEPARYYVQLEVNDHLHGHVSPAVRPFEGDRMIIWADCLLGAIYLSFAAEISGLTTVAKVCPQCGGLFTGQRGHKVYCSDKCRVMASRARRSQ